MKWNIKTHIIGKVYDLTQENMNAMISDIEKLLNIKGKNCDECKGTGEPTRKHSDLSTYCEDCKGTGLK